MKKLFFQLIILLILLNGEIALAKPTTSEAETDDLPLTSYQLEKLHELKHIMKPQLPFEYLNDDIYLTRWLRGNDFNVAKAAGAFIDHLKWAKENNFENVHNEDWGIFPEEYSYSVDTFDRKGRPVILWDVGDWNFRKAWIVGHRKKLYRWIMKMFDEARLKIEGIQAEGRKNITRYTLVCDLGDINPIINMSPSTIQFYMEGTFGSEAHFPQYIHKIYMINTPTVFLKLLQTMKSGLHSQIRKALQIYGKDERQWGPVLREIIDPSQLPPRYGGTKLVQEIDDD